MTGESCQEDGDCETNNCDPKTDRCVPKKVCSNTNLDLCNKEECIDLNNHYSYAKREFKYDEAESGVKCKLEDKETDTDTEDEEDDIALGGFDPSIIEAADCEGNELYWYLEPQDRNSERLTSAGCKLKIPGSVFYESEESQDFQERKIMYGLNDMSTGLYCKIGYKFCPNQSTGVEGDETSQTEETDDPDDQEGGGDETDICSNLDDMVGISSPILPEHISGISSERLSEYCKEGIDRSECRTGAWPPYSYFERNRNPESYDENLTIPIIDRCKRCDNGWYKPVGENQCTQCKDESNTPVETINQYKLVGNDYINIEDGVIGNNISCLDYGRSGSLTCGNAGYCDGRHMIRNGDPDNTHINSYNEFWDTCCKKCPKNKKFKDNREDTNAVVCTETNCCSPCPPGQKQSAAGNECVDCPPGDLFNPPASPTNDNGTCTPCGENKIVSDSGGNCLNSIQEGDYCSNWDISNGHCEEKSDLEVDDNPCTGFNCGGGQNRRQIFLDYYNNLNEHGYQHDQAPTYENCCQFTGCSAGTRARKLNNATKEYYCRDCPDVCGINHGATQGMDSSTCSCQPNENYNGDPSVPNSDILGEWNIGRSDTGTWIFLIPTTRKQNIGGERETNSVDSRLSIIGRLNGTSDDEHLRRGIVDINNLGDRCCTSPDPECQRGWYKFGQFIAGYPYSTNASDQTVGGTQYKRRDGNISTWSYSYTSRWVYPGNEDSPDIYFYYHIWSTLKDMYVIKSTDVVSNTPPGYSALVREVSIAIFLTKEDLCNYCQTNQLVINTNNIRWQKPWQIPEEWSTFPIQSQDIIIDFQANNGNEISRNNICKYCSNNYSPPPLPTPPSTFLSDLSIENDETTTLMDSNNADQGGHVSWDKSSPDQGGNTSCSSWASNSWNLYLQEQR